MTTPTMSTDDVSPGDRLPYWSSWIDRLFCGLQSDSYGDTDFHGRLATARAGDVVLTRLEANRHRVMRSASNVRTSGIGYLKIVAPFQGCAEFRAHAGVSPTEYRRARQTATGALIAG